MVTGLTYLMTSLTVGLLVMIARGQQHETRDGVDIYTFPVALTRAIAILSLLIGLLGAFVWQRGPIDGRSARGGNLQLVVHFLVRLDVGLNELWRHQPHCMPKSLQCASPVVRAGTRFHANQTRWQVHENLRNLSAPQLLAQHGLSSFVNPVNLKHVFRQINADRCNLHVGAPIQLSGCLTHPLWHADAVKGGGVHPIALRQAKYSSQNYASVSTTQTPPSSSTETTASAISSAFGDGPRPLSLRFNDPGCRTKMRQLIGDPV